MWKCTGEETQVWKLLNVEVSGGKSWKAGFLSDVSLIRVNFIFCQIKHVSFRVWYPVFAWEQNYTQRFKAWKYCSSGWRWEGKSRGQCVSTVISGSCHIELDWKLNWDFTKSFNTVGEALPWTLSRISILAFLLRVFWGCHWADFGLFGVFFLSICSSDELFKLSADCSQNNRPGICKGSGSRKFMHFVCWNIAIFGKTFFSITSTGAEQLWLGTAKGWNLQKWRSWGPVPRVSPLREPHLDAALSLQKCKGIPLSKCLFMILFRLQNSLRINPTRLLLITGALGRWCLNALQDLDLSYIIYSHLPGKTLTLQEELGSP